MEDIKTQHIQRLEEQMFIGSRTERRRLTVSWRQGINTAMRKKEMGNRVWKKKKKKKKKKSMASGDQKMSQTLR